MNTSLLAVRQLTNYFHSSATHSQMTGSRPIRRLLSVFRLFSAQMTPCCTSLLFIRPVASRRSPRSINFQPFTISRLPSYVMASCKMMIKKKSEERCQKHTERVESRKERGRRQGGDGQPVAIMSLSEMYDGFKEGSGCEG